MERIEFRHAQPVNFQRRPEIEEGRRVAYVVKLAEVGLGLNLPSSLPFETRPDAILQAAMDAPEAVTPEQFNLVYLLRATA